MSKGLTNKNITGIVLVIGLAAVSVTAYISSDGRIGEGWGILSFLVLVGWSWN